MSQYDWGSILVQAGIFVFVTTSQPGREAEHSPPSCAIRLHVVIIKHGGVSFFALFYSLAIQSILNLSVMHVLFINKC
jgi:hypothetical protein